MELSQILKLKTHKILCYSRSRLFIITERLYAIENSVFMYHLVNTEKKKLCSSYLFIPFAHI